MAQGGVLGNGCKVAYSAASPITWVNIGQQRDITFPTFEADKVEITTHSVTNNLRRFMSGLITVGDPGFTVLSDLDPATDAAQAFLRNANKLGTQLWFRIEVPVNRARTLFWGVEFLASVKNFAPATPIDDVQTVRYELSFEGTDLGYDAAAAASEIS